MIIKVLINGNLFVSTSHHVDLDLWHRSIDPNIVQSSCFVSIGSTILKCRNTERFLFHEHINKQYNRGEYTKLPDDIFICTNFINFVESKLGYKCDDSPYSYKVESLYKIFDELCIL